MTETRIADNVAWYLHQEVKKIKKEKVQQSPPKKVAKPIPKIDVKFLEWAKRENIDLRDLKVWSNDD